MTEREIEILEHCRKGSAMIDRLLAGEHVERAEIDAILVLMHDCGSVVFADTIERLSKQGQPPLPF